MGRYICTGGCWRIATFLGMASVGLTRAIGMSLTEWELCSIAPVLQCSLCGSVQPDDVVLVAVEWPDSIAAGVWLKFALSPAPRAPLLSHIRHCHARGLSRE